MDAVCRLPGGVYNFGSETSLSMYEMTYRLAAALGRDVPVTDAPPRHNLWLNCEKAPAFPFSPAEAVRLCLEALRSFYRPNNVKKDPEAVASGSFFMVS